METFWELRPCRASTKEKSVIGCKWLIWVKARLEAKMVKNKHIKMERRMNKKGQVNFKQAGS